VHIANEKFQIPNFTEIRPVVVTLFHVDRRTDDVTRVIVAFAKFLPTIPKRINFVEILALATVQ
jgi:hypothetical protein